MTLRYPSQLNPIFSDYMTFTPEEYRSNNAGGAAGPPAVGAPIVLYMPNSTPAVGNEQSWNTNTFEGPLGAIKRDLALAGVEASQELLGSADGGISAITDDLAEKFKARRGEAGGAVRQAAVNAVAGFAGTNANALMAIQRGEIYNPNVELTYQGPGMRSFSFDYNFIPKNAAETNIVSNIIMTFKKLSAPKDLGSGMLKVPYVWNIKYMSGGGQNPYMHAFKKCACLGVTVQYNAGSDMHQTYTDGMPVTTTLKLTFQEVDIILRDDHDASGSLHGY